MPAWHAVESDQLDIFCDPRSMPESTKQRRKRGVRPTVKSGLGVFTRSSCHRMHDAEALLQHRLHRLAGYARITAHPSGRTQHEGTKHDLVRDLSSEWWCDQLRGQSGASAAGPARRVLPNSLDHWGRAGSAAGLRGHR